MFLKNIVMSGIKKITSFTQKTEEPPRPRTHSDPSDSALSRSRLDQEMVRESLGK